MIRVGYRSPINLGYNSPINTPPIEVEEQIAPTLISATIPSGGSSLALLFDMPVKDVDDGGMSLTVDGSPVFIIFPTPPGDGEIAVWSGSLLGSVSPGQVCLLSYTPGQVQSAGIPLEAFSNTSVTNNS